MNPIREENRTFPSLSLYFSLLLVNWRCAQSVVALLSFRSFFSCSLFRAHLSVLSFPVLIYPSPSHKSTPEKRSSQFGCRCFQHYSVYKWFNRGSYWACRTSCSSSGDATRCHSSWQIRYQSTRSRKSWSFKRWLHKSTREAKYASG